MAAMTLKKLAAGIPVQELVGETGKRITGIAYDSHDVKPGFLFAALDGAHTDGHRYIAEAVRRGAVAIVHSRAPERLEPGVGYARVENTRAALSPLSAEYFGHPSRRLAVIGVTGTDGKSSTVSFIHQLLGMRGRRAGFLSTVSFHTGEELVKNPFRQSTPEAPEVHGMLADMADRGVEFAVVEATSHGLSTRTNRLGDVLFDAAVMTNVTHEHLEFHGSYEQYRSDKANLFRALARSAGKPVDCPRFGVVNADDPAAEYFRRCTTLPVLSYAVRQTAGGGADLSAVDAVVGLSSSEFLLAWEGRSARCRLAIPGPFWVPNVAAACLTVSRLLGEDPLDLAPLVERLKGIQGRMESVDMGQAFRVIVDYAHTPAAFSVLLPWVRGLTQGKMIAVFGSAGERDRAKRPLQGRIASESCDVLVLTDEDPRGEDRMSVLEEIAEGCRGRKRGEDLLLVPDRPEAIATAFSLAGPEDVVLLLGKGHEGGIISADGSHPYDERTEAERCLRAMGFTG
jgi:UDP-N-acetylmuramoyl-L-alanyl-D-glutamate--2,6-diaminopimelate ligase